MWLLIKFTRRIHICTFLVAKDLKRLVLVVHYTLQLVAVSSTEATGGNQQTLNLNDLQVGRSEREHGSFCM